MEVKLTQMPESLDSLGYSETSAKTTYGRNSPVLQCNRSSLNSAYISIQSGPIANSAMMSKYPEPTLAMGRWSGEGED